MRRANRASDGIKTWQIVSCRMDVDDLSSFFIVFMVSRSTLAVAKTIPKLTVKIALKGNQIKLLTWLLEYLQCPNAQHDDFTRLRASFMRQIK